MYYAGEAKNLQKLIRESSLLLLQMPWPLHEEQVLAYILHSNYSYL